MGGLTHGWWEDSLAVVKNLHMHLPWDPAISPLGIHLTKTKTMSMWRPYTSVIVPLCGTAPNWEWNKSPSSHEESADGGQSVKSDTAKQWKGMSYWPTLQCGRVSGPLCWVRRTQMRETQHHEVPLVQGSRRCNTSVATAVRWWFEWREGRRRVPRWHRKPLEWQVYSLSCCW